MDMGGMDMGNTTSNTTSASSSMDMGMGGASACKSESISVVLVLHLYTKYRPVRPRYPCASLQSFGTIIFLSRLTLIAIAHSSLHIFRLTRFPLTFSSPRSIIPSRLPRST